MTHRFWAVAGLISLAASVCVLLLVLFLGGPSSEDGERASLTQSSGAGQQLVRENREGSGQPGSRSGRADVGAASPEVNEAVARFKDAAVPLKERKKEIDALARKGDARSVEVLMALGDERTYLNRFAVEAIGQVRSTSPKTRSRMTDYLKGKLVAGDALVLCAAIRSLARLSGEAAVPELAAVIRSNRVRADGHEEMIRTAAAQALGGVGSAKAVPVLVEELGRSEEKSWNLEYGSQLLAALGRIDTPEGRAAAAAYADRLAARLPRDPMARKFFESKVKEARAVARER